MEKSDLIRLIEHEDELYRVDKVFERLTGYGHADEAFHRVLTNREKTPEERAEALMIGLY